MREECTIGDRVSIWANSVIDYGCTLGDGVRIHTGCYIAQFTVIEAGAFLAPGVAITNDLYPGDDASASVMAGPVIEAGAQIGGGVTILPYVRIGAGALVGAGSVVTKDIPAGMVAFGNPAISRRTVDILATDRRSVAEAPAARLLILRSDGSGEPAVEQGAGPFGDLVGYVRLGEQRRELAQHGGGPTVGRVGISR